MRSALEKLAEYYSKGYIDPEFVVKDSGKANEDVIAGNALMFNGAWHSIANPLTPMWNALPDSSMAAIPFISGDDGTCSVVKDTWWTTDNTAITTSCEHPEALLYVFGDNLESYYRNETELRETLKNGITTSSSIRSQRYVVHSTQTKSRKSIPTSDSPASFTFMTIPKKRKAAAS